MKAVILAISLFKRSLKNKYALLIYILLPIVGVVLPILIYSNKYINNYNIAIINKDTSSYSKLLVKELNYENINIINKEKILNGKYNLVIKIESGFKENLINNSNKAVEFIYMKESKEIYKYQQIINNKVNEIKNIINVIGDNEEEFGRVYKKLCEDDENIRMQFYDNNNLSIEALGMIILFSMIITSVSLSIIIQDKNNNVHKRIIYADVSCIEYISAQIIWSFLIALIQTIAIIFTMNILKINSGISNNNIFYILILIWIVSISFGIFSISFCNSEEQLSIINIMLVFPSCMLSGCLWPIGIMDESIQKLSMILPQRRILLIMEQINNGVNINIIIINVLFIILISLLILVIGIIKIDNSNFKVIK